MQIKTHEISRSYGETPNYLWSLCYMFQPGWVIIGCFQYLSERVCETLQCICIDKTVNYLQGQQITDIFIQITLVFNVKCIILLRLTL
jgi:hypothetical protein